MTKENTFLQVDKTLFTLGLNPTEILLLAQIMEFNRTTGDFFMSDAALAELFGVSTKTISRALTVLEDKKLIIRETKNIKGGKVRHIKLTKDNMTFDATQGSKCLLTTDNLSIDNGQNDLIKKNIKENIKDNSVINQPQAADCITLDSAPRGKVEAVREVMKSSTDTNGEFKF